VRVVILALFSAVALTSCGLTGIGQKPAKQKPSEPYGPSGIPPNLRPKAPAGGIPAIAGGIATAPQPGSGLTPQEDIVYTDPDDPDAALPELSTLLATAKRGPWEDSETIAKQRSSREGKAMLIWFTDSQNSPMCKALSQELFSTKEFGDWATEKLIRLRVDSSNVRAKDPDADLDESESYRSNVKNYYAALKKRYKVMGFPSLIFLNPSGEVIGSYRGYKRGGADFLWGQLKHSEAVASNAYQAWRTSLEKKGYREWQDRRDRKVFARLLTYSKGELTFIEPDGTRSRTQEIKLSDKDQAWITEQKKLRNLE